MTGSDELRRARAENLRRVKGAVRRVTEAMYLVRSASDPKRRYAVEKVDGAWRCNCPDYDKRQAPCKHLHLIDLVTSGKADILPPQTKRKKRPTYRQNWRAYNQARRLDWVHFPKLLQDLLVTVPEPPMAKGQRYSLRHSLAFTVLKVHTRLNSRDAEGLIRRIEPTAQWPHFNLASRILMRNDLTPVLHHLLARSAFPLGTMETKWAIDSTGIRTSSFGFYARERGVRLENQWVKLHAFTGIETNVVAACDISLTSDADVTHFEPLLRRVYEAGFTVQKVCGDKAYCARPAFDAAASIGAEAFIPFRRNASARSEGSNAWVQAYHAFHLDPEGFYKAYHLRSNAEATFASLKRRYGDTVRSKHPVARTNELLCRLIGRNIELTLQGLYEHGLFIDFSKSPKQAKNRNREDEAGREQP